MEKKAELEEKVYELVDFLYVAYGSATGYLFGLPPDARPIVAVIVKIIVERLEKKES